MALLQVGQILFSLIKIYQLYRISICEYLVKQKFFWEVFKHSSKHNQDLNKKIINNMDQSGQNAICSQNKTKQHDSGPTTSDCQVIDIEAIEGDKINIEEPLQSSTPVCTGASPLCSGCGQQIQGEHIIMEENIFHPNCILCSQCANVIEAEGYYKEEDRVVCKSCHDTGKVCAECGLPIKDQHISAMNKDYHILCQKAKKLIPIPSCNYLTDPSLIPVADFTPQLSYIRQNVKDDCSAYELSERDLLFLQEYNRNNTVELTPQNLEEAIQYLELKKYYERYVAFKPGEGVDPGRNYHLQWELLKRHPLRNDPPNNQIISHYEAEVKRLDRPLLRVFMRATENEPRLSIAFRPSRPYKQKRLKRIATSIGELEQIQKRLKIENKVTSHCMQAIFRREQLKKDILQIQQQQWLREIEEDHLVEPLDLPQRNTDKLLENGHQLSKQIKELKLIQYTPIEAKQQDNNNQLLLPPHLKYKNCNIEDCQFNLFSQLKPTYLTSETIEIMTDQFASMKWKGCQVEWPENPTILRSVEHDEDTLIIRPHDIIGQTQIGKSLVVGTENKTYIIKETREYLQNSMDQGRGRKARKTVSINQIDPIMKRMSCVEGLKIDFEHFVYHRSTLMEQSHQEIEQIKKICIKKRGEMLRKERQIILKNIKKKKKEELLKKRKNILTIRISINDIQQEAKKIEPIKQTGETKFQIASQIQKPVEQYVPPPPPPILKTESISSNKFKLFRKVDGGSDQSTRIKLVSESPRKFKLYQRDESSQLMRIQNFGQPEAQNIFAASSTKVSSEEFKQVDI